MEAILADFVSRDFIYVALWFRHLYFVRAGRQETQRIFTRYPHHVTLAYLLALSELQRKRIEEGLNEVLRSWWSEDCFSTHYALLGFRKFLSGRPKSEWPKKKSALLLSVAHKHFESRTRLRQAASF